MKVILKRQVEVPSGDPTLALPFGTVWDVVYGVPGRHVLIMSPEGEQVTLLPEDYEVYEETDDGGKS